jgi:hypothetical protein
MMGDDGPRLRIRLDRIYHILIPVNRSLFGHPHTDTTFTFKSCLPRKFILQLLHKLKIPSHCAVR